MSRTTPLPNLVIRWTVGDVSTYGFEALSLSVRGAWRLFGSASRYIVCVNTIGAGEAARRTGPLPCDVRWVHVTAEDVPPFIRARLDGAFAEGVGWKFAPLRLDDEAFELALDNDCILWRLPPAMDEWLDRADATLVAEDVRRCVGCFDACCGPGPRNSGIRGLGPGSPFPEHLDAVLRASAVTLTSETDEQGLQVAALARSGPPLVVSTEDVSICSPFYPHQPDVGRCGAHFVGLNSKAIGWSYDGRPALEVLHEHWRRLRVEVRRRLEHATTGG